ncbi:MAG: hypothetical protein IH840_03815 [Candidatus Heimdallarchaeota archaeon]|nr:hypothetical protein [Candidatus Heimdallarchaeota archaeon]
MDEMEVDYSLQNGKMNEHQVNLVRSYYNNWEFHDSIQLKFRYIKVFGLNLRDNQAQWVILQRKTNKRRIYNHTLAENIQSLIDCQFIPYRIFQSVAEWLSPIEIEKKQPHYMLKTGIIVLENDDTFVKSVQTAIQVCEDWDQGYRLIYSGNKSVHVWLSIDENEYLTGKSNREIWGRGQREKIDKQIRKTVHQNIQARVDNEIDHRSAVDTRRVVPIVGSLNAFTGRIVSELFVENLIKADLTTLQNTYQLEDWHN